MMQDSTQGRAAAPAIPVTVWLLGIVSLLMDVSSEMINTLLPLYLAGGLGASVLAIGFIEGLSVAIATATKFLSGLFIDASGRAKPLAVLGYGLGALSRLVFPLAVSLDQIVLAKALDRVGKGIRGTPRDAIIAAVTPPEIRGASFGLRKSLDALGGFIARRGGDIEQADHLAAGLGHAAVGGEVGGGTAKRALPEAAAVEEVGDGVLHRPAQFARQPRD